MCILVLAPTCGGTGRDSALWLRRTGVVGGGGGGRDMHRSTRTHRNVHANVATNLYVAVYSLKSARIVLSFQVGASDVRAISLSKSLWLPSRLSNLSSFHLPGWLSFSACRVFPSFSLYPLFLSSGSPAISVLRLAFYFCKSGCAEGDNPKGANQAQTQISIDVR